MPPAEIYPWIIGAVVPRPIAFVSTIDRRGVVNLAPFSFYNAVSSAPPVLMFSVSRKRAAAKKDTLLNIEENGEFVVNSTHDWMAEEINQTSADYPHGISEAEKVGFHELPSTWVKPPRIAECGIHFECRLERIVEIGEGEVGSVSVVFGRIVGMHIHPSMMTGNYPDFDKIRPLGRLGGAEWSKGGTVFTLPRPKPPI